MTPLFRGFLLIALVSLCAVGVAFSADIKDLQWQAFNEYTDGTPYTNRKGFSVHFGTSPDELSETRMVNNPAAVRVNVTGLQPGVYYVCIKDVAEDGNTSACSNVVQKTAAELAKIIKAPVLQ